MSEPTSSLDNPPESVTSMLSLYVGLAAICRLKSNLGPCGDEPARNFAARLWSRSRIFLAPSVVQRRGANGTDLMIDLNMTVCNGRNHGTKK